MGGQNINETILDLPELKDCEYKMKDAASSGKSSVRIK
jgi:type VI secretion system secreted protein VgrG